jgi:hypothetical protein
VTGRHDLEAAYRRRLRAYPRRWRDRHGEELLAVLLAAAQDSGRSRPAPAETVDLLRHGLAARARAAMRPFSPAVRGRVATLSLAGGASLAMVCLLLGELPAVIRPRSQQSYGSMTTFAPFLTLGALLYLGWLVTLVMTVAGRLRPAGTTGAVLVALSGGVAATSVAARSHPIAAPPVYLSVVFAGVSLLMCMGRVDLSRTGRWLMAVGSTGLAGILTSVATLPRRGPGAFGVEDPRWVFYRGWQSGIQLIAQYSWILLAVTLVVAAASYRRPGWFAASAIAGLPWLCFTLFFIQGGQVAQLRLHVLVLFGLAVLAVFTALGYRAGIRIGRRSGPDVTA